MLGEYYIAQKTRVSCSFYKITKIRFEHNEWARKRSLSIHNISSSSTPIHNKTSKTYDVLAQYYIKSLISWVALSDRAKNKNSTGNKESYVLNYIQPHCRVNSKIWNIWSIERSAPALHLDYRPHRGGILVGSQIYWS